jgi:hypothetical protein
MSARAVPFALAALIFQGSAAFGQSQPPPLSPLEPAEVRQLEAALERAAKLPNDEFCQKPEAFYTFDRRLCAFAGAAERRCPALREACRAQSHPPRRRSLLSYVGDDALKILGYSLLIALIVGVLFAINALLKDLLGGAAPSAEPEPAAERAALSLTPAESSSNRDVQRRLRRARELAAQGNYAVALGELHAAVVLALDARGAIEARKGRTNGDYARELAARPELSAAFREVTRNVESVQFGARAADRSLFERSLERSASLVGPGLIALGVALSLILTGCSRELGSRSSPAAACGTSAAGYSFLCSVLEETRGARRRHRSLRELDGDVSVLVMVADELGEQELDAVASWVEYGGGTLVTTQRFPEIDDELGLGRRGPPCAGELALEGASPTDAKLVVDLHPTLQPSAKLGVYAGCGAGAVAVHGFYGDGQVLALSAPSLLSNASLAAGSNAELLLRMIPRTKGAVEIVGNWTGTSAGSPFASLRSAGLLPWLAHLALLGFAFARFRGTPFARRHALREDPRRRFVEHVQALGERWADARASRVALSAYAAWGLDVLRERTSGGGQANLSDLADALSRRGGGPPDIVLRTLAKCRLAQEGDDGASEPEHLETLRALGKLISETGGSRWT